MSDDELKEVNEARLYAHYWRQKAFAMYSALCQATGQYQELMNEEDIFPWEEPNLSMENVSAKELLNALYDKLFSSVGGPPWEDAICALYHHECWNCPAQNERERCIKDEWQSYLSGIREQFERHPEPKEI